MDDMCLLYTQSKKNVFNTNININCNNKVYNAKNSPKWRYEGSRLHQSRQALFNFCSINLEFFFSFFDDLWIRSFCPVDIG